MTEIRAPGIQAERTADAAGSSGWLDDVQRIWQELSGLARDQLRLAALETRLAGISLVTMIAAGVIVAVLLVSAWLGLIAAVILLLVGTGLTIGVALALGVAANLLLALLLANMIRIKSENLLWSATLGNRQGVSPAAPLRGIPDGCR